MTSRAMPDPDTDAWLAEHRLEPTLDNIDEPGSETTRGTVGRGRMSVEAGRTASALDDASGIDEASGVDDAAREPTPSRVLLPDQRIPVAIGGTATGGTATMSLNTFDRIQRRPSAGPPSSMRVMETGLALIAIAVALLLNLGR